MAAAKILSLVQQGYEAEKAIELDDKGKDCKQKARDKLKRRASDDDLLVITQSFSVLFKACKDIASTHNQCFF